MFSQADLSKIVAATIPPDVTNGPAMHAVVFTVDSAGAQVVASFKKTTNVDGFSWELQAAARHDWSGDNSLAGRMVLSW
jgi:hypothetical protein